MATFVVESEYLRNDIVDINKNQGGLNHRDENNMTADDVKRGTYDS